MELIQHIPHAVPVDLKEQVNYEAGKVISMTLCKQPGCGITLFAFDEGEGIGTHAAGGDAMATILEGTAQITVGGDTHTVNAGESIVMPVGIPHSLKAMTRFKMLLVVAFPGEN